jgi:HEAT repeat protein
MRALRQIRSWFLPVAVGLVCAVIAMAGPHLAAQAQAPGAIPTLDQILKEVSTYDGGIESAAMWKLRDYVYARKDDPAGRAECEAKLLQFLRTSASPVAKMAACRYLRVIAGDGAVAALQAMLQDDRSVDMALYALQQIPGGAAENALIQSLKTTGGPAKIAVIAALGERRDAAAVPALAPLLQQPAASGAAVVALGRIGGDAAAAALVAAFTGAAADLKRTIAPSILRCADSSMAAKNTLAARRLYETVSSDASLPDPLRSAAAMGRIAAGGEGAPALLLDLLTGQDTAAQAAAIARIKDVFAPEAIGRVCALLPGLPEKAQVQLLAVLSGYPGDRVLPTVLQAVRSTEMPVRLAALNAIESTGDATVVPLLAETAARTTGEEQSAARAALGVLKGRAVDEAILALLSKNQADDVQCELLVSAAERRIFVAEVAAAASLTSPSPRVREQALRALRVIGAPSDLPAVLDVLLAAADESERTEAEKTVVALTKMIAADDARSQQITARLAGAKDVDARVRLLGVLPLVGDASALPALRAALEDDTPEVIDAAVRAMTAWPTSAARDDILRLAQESRNETHRLLAIGGFVRTVRLDPYRDPKTAVADLRMAAALAWRPEEYKLVLGALTVFPCGEAVDLASGFLPEPSVNAEAQVAIDKIKAALSKKEKSSSTGR